MLPWRALVRDLTSNRVGSISVITPSYSALHRYLAELADHLKANNRTAFFLTAPPLRLPGAVGSPANGGTENVLGRHALDLTFQTTQASQPFDLPLFGQTDTLCKIWNRIKSQWKPPMCSHLDREEENSTPTIEPTTSTIVFFVSGPTGVVLHRPHQ